MSHIEIFAVAVSLRKLACHIDIALLGFNDADRHKPREQHVVGKTPFTRFIFSRGPLGNRHIAASLRAGAIGKFELFGIGLPACFAQLGIDKIATLALAQIERARGCKFHDLLAVERPFGNTQGRQFGLSGGQLGLQSCDACCRLRLGLLLLAFEDGDIAIERNQLLLLGGDLGGSLLLGKAALFQLLLQRHHFLVIVVALPLWQHKNGGSEIILFADQAVVPDPQAETES